MPYEIRKHLFQGRPDGQFVVLRVIARRHDARMRRLVELFVGQPDSEGRQPLHTQPLDQHRDQQARVEPAAQEGAHLNVAHHVQAQRLDDLLVELVDQLRLAHGCMFGFEREVPIRAHLRGAALLENEQMSRRQLHDVAEHRERRRNEAQREILIQCREIQPAKARIEREQRLDFRAEREALRLRDVEERLLTKVIARCEQPLLARIPECESEHAAQVLEQTIAVRFVQADDHFAIAHRHESMAVRLELLAQLQVVVDLAVANQPDRALGIAQRLPPALQVDDRESPVSEHGAALPMDALAVRTAMRKSAQHRGDVRALGIERPDDARDAAHQRSPVIRAPRAERTASSNTAS